MIVYDAPVLVMGVWAAGSYGHQGATPRLSGGHHHQDCSLPLPEVLRVKADCEHFDYILPCYPTED